MIPRQKISLSLSNLLIIGSAAFLLLLLWQLKGLIIILMIAIVIASTLSPLVKSVENIGVPRWFSVISVYLMLILVLTGIGLLLGPTIVAQLQLLLEKLPLYIETLNKQIQLFMTEKGFTEPDILDFINQQFNLQSVISWTFKSSQKLLIGVSDITRGIVGLSLIHI